MKYMLRAKNMSTKNIKKNTLYLFLLIMIVVSTACTDKEEVSYKVEVEEQLVEMTFLSALTQQPRSVENDEEVVELDLVICKNNIYQYKRQAYTSDYATFRSTLKIDEDVDIYFFANCRSTLESSKVLKEGNTWDEIQSKLLITYTDTIIDSRSVLPMWGQIKEVTISNDHINNLGKVKLLRCVAAANIYFTLENGMEFKPEIVYVYYGADKAFVAPEKENLIVANNEVREVIQPISPANMRTIKKVEATTRGNSFINSIYMFDNDTSGDFKQHPENKRTRLVVGGYLEDSDELTYYPLDFQQSGQHKLMQVTRNHTYTLIISAVNSEGWPDPDEAVQHASVNLDYEVITWEEFEDKDIAIDGADYLSISSKYVKLYKNRGTTNSINLSGTFTKERINISFQNSVNGSTTGIENGIENNRFRVEISGEETNLKVNFTALEDFSHSNPLSNKDTLIIEAGRIQFYIRIEQVTSTGWNNGGNKDVEF